MNAADRIWLLGLKERAFGLVRRWSHVICLIALLVLAYCSLSRTP